MMLDNQEKMLSKGKFSSTEQNQNKIIKEMEKNLSAA